MNYTYDDIEKLAWEYAMRFEYINIEYIELMGKHIKELGRLTELDIHRLRQMAKMGANIDKINEMLASISNAALDDLYKLYDDLLENEYKNAAELYAYRGIVQKALVKNKSLQKHLESVKKKTKNTFYNISKTTVISDEYKKIVDAAIVAIHTGMEDYSSAIKKQLKKAATGMRVTYASGVTRRLDSAIYMNVLEGVRQLNMGVRDIMGKEFGADGVEISAHFLCAPDHQPIQGLQYARGGKGKYVDGEWYESYDEMNGGLIRKIGTCNCKHYTMPIILGISEQTYSKSELKRYIDNSKKKIKIGESEKTKYEWSQNMRSIETQIRYAKEKYMLAKAAGNKELAKEADKKIKELYAKYESISKKTGLEEKKERTFVPKYK